MSAESLHVEFHVEQRRRHRRGPLCGVCGVGARRPGQHDCKECHAADMKVRRERGHVSPNEERYRAALEQIIALNLAKTPEGRDDFYSGPGRFFEAHRIAREALGESTGEA